MPKESIVFPGGVLLSTLLIPLALPLFQRFGVVDRPNARSSHTTAIPRGTGIVVVLSFATMLLAFAVGVPEYLGQITMPGQHWDGFSRNLQALLAAVFILVAVGFLDDARGVPAWVKFVFQGGCAMILISGGFVMPLPEFFSNPVEQAWLERGVTLFWIVGVINAVNFIDGVDGLATTLSVVCMGIFVGISHIVPREEAVAREVNSLARAVSLIGYAGAGSALPFLLYNLSPAKCFLGDSGSTFFGLILAVLGILTTRYETIFEAGAVGGGFQYSFLIVPWLVLFVPIADAVRVAFGRILRGVSPFRADNRHLHHLLQRAGLSANQMVFLVSLTVLIFGLVAAILVRSSKSPYIMLGIFMLLVYGLLWFLKSSYRARRFVTLALNRRLLHFMEVTEGYENTITFKERFEQELARTRRHAGSLATVVVNTVGLKHNPSVPNPLENPRFLDNVLRSMRREDVKCRFSSDRLAFILVETDKELAGRVCDRLRLQFDSVRHGESAELQVGIGVAAFPGDGATVTALLEHAERDALRDMSHLRVAPRTQGAPLVLPTGGMPSVERRGTALQPVAVSAGKVQTAAIEGGSASTWKAQDSGERENWLGK